MRATLIVAVIAAAIVAGGAAVLLLREGPRRAEQSPHPAAEAGAPATIPASAAAAQPLQAVLAPGEIAPPEMMEAKTALEAQYAERRKDIPEEIAKPIDDDIGVIEGIAADLLAALTSEPDNDDLKRMLVQTYRNEMKLLKKALHLSGEEDDVTADEPETPTTETN